MNDFKRVFYGQMSICAFTMAVWFVNSDLVPYAVLVNIAYWLFLFWLYRIPFFSDKQ